MRVAPIPSGYAVSLLFGMLLGTAICSRARAQTPTPTPNGEFLCSAGPRDGLACHTDADCAPDGVCVTALGLCAGGPDDGLVCDCIAGSCTGAPACSLAPTFGTCQGGVNAALCCDVTHNCAGGGPCVGTQKLCIGGGDIGVACLRDDQCPGSVCQSTGAVCDGGDFNNFPCVDDVDCRNAGGSQGGTCTTAVPPPTPTPSPTGEFLCSAGPRDGLACNNDANCGPDGVCVIAVGLCVGGPDDGLICDCIAGSCTGASACSLDATFGTCQGGVNAALCCNVTHNCSGGGPCVGTQKLCIGGDAIGLSCLRDEQCPGSVCQSTGAVCDGGDFNGLACIDDNDCRGGACVGPVVATPCIGDCDGNGVVTVDELITMVNVALGGALVSACPIGDADGSGVITVDEIIEAVNFALSSCPA
jgi:hypothetical protein